MHTDIFNYLIYLLMSILMIPVFLKIYSAITPLNEFLLIRQGNNAAALSLGGAVVGFSLTVVSSILHANTVVLFLCWTAGALIVQLLAYAITHRVLRNSRDQIESGNTAYGGMMGAISLSLGAINAACVY